MVKKKVSAYNGFINTKYKPTSTDVVVQYKITPARGYSFRQVAEMTAGESSVGTWTEVQTTNKRVQRLAPKVFYLNKKDRRVRIAYPLKLFEYSSVPNILSSIGGNVFGMKAAKGLLFEDITFPKKMIKKFKGPRFGIKGLRKYLGVKKRPLVGTIVKPKVGLNEHEHALVAYDSWIGGCDIVKDDENLGDQDFNRFKKRFLLTIKKCRDAEKKTGEKKVYLINCTAEYDEMLKRIDFVQKNGGNYIMLDILTIGWGSLQSIRDHIKLPIHAHRAGHAMYDRDPNHGMTMEVIAQFARLIGVDTLHIGTAYGKMSGGKKEIIHIEKEIESPSTRKTMEHLSQKWYGLKPIFAVASGGVHPRMLPKIIKFMGNDVVLQAGGGIHGHPDGTVAGAIAMRQSVDAAMNNIPLGEYAKTHEELKKALKKWGR